MAQDVLPSESLCAFDNVQALARLLHLEQPVAETWEPSEYSSMLAHLLATPVAEAIAALDAASGLGVQQLVEQEGRSGVTFNDALARGGATASLLGIIKWFAQQCLTIADSPLPRAIAIYLYSVAVAHALRDCGTRISSSPDRELAGNLQWLAGQSWLSTDARNRVESALTWLETEL
jgi:hypothetical protein